jgi:hypothetical protein
MPSYRIQYALDDLDNPEPLIARTDLILAANMPVGERMVKIEMERYQGAVGFRILDSSDRVLASYCAP